MPAGTCKHVQNILNGRTGSQVDTPGMVELLLSSSKTCMHADIMLQTSKQTSRQRWQGVACKEQKSSN